MKKFFGKTLISAIAGVVLAFAGCSADSSSDDSPTQYTVSYQTAHGTAPSAVQIASGATITDTYLPSLSADDYVFEGWTLDGTVITASSNKTVTENITLVAKWRAFDPASDVKYKILHKQESVDGSSTITVDTETKVTTKDNLSVTISPKTYDGFESPDAETKSVNADGTSEFELVYTRKTIVLTLNLDGGSGTESLTGKYGASVTAPANPTKDGYTFATWNPDLPETFPAADATYTATWTEVPQDKTVKVTKIEISGSASVAKGGSITLKATVTPSNATTKTVTWSADVTDGVTLSGGKLTVANTCTAEKINVTAKATDDSGIESDPFAVSVIDISSVSAGITITEEKGWLESSYIKWSPATSDVIDGYNVYIKATGDEYTKLDDMLVRAYSNTAGGTTIDYYRADALGLKAGTYQMKVVGTASGVEASGVYAESSAITVEAHDRSGFAFNGGTDATCPGAYKLDGTLKANAVVLYITETTKDTVSYDVVSDSKGKTTNAVGLQAILNILKKGYDSRPYDFRFIGNITDLATMEGGDIVISGSGKTKRVSNGITIEGVGDDTVFNGWGLRIKNASYIEVRNIGFMNCDSDEGDDLGLQQDNDHIWSHNNDMFYGGPGGDSDQAKGDGALDTKKSMYVTHSYNHFWDTGKSNLVGNGETINEQNYLTFHHNWYDHSDSRHPRIRVATVHVYNNYYDGNAKYGVGATLASSVYVEGNYFRNCKFPVLSSLQGNDIYAGTGTADAANNGTFSKEAGGLVKTYNNTIVDTNKTTSYWPYSGTGTAWTKGVSGTVPSGVDTTKHFDAYEVSSRTATVPAAVVTASGGTSYNNFDTASDFYSYAYDSPEEAKAKVIAYAGRMNGSDFSWTFTDADDTLYSVNSGLKSALTGYKTKLVKVLGSNASSSGNNDSGDSGDDGNGGNGDGNGDGENTTPVVVDGTTIVSFTGTNASSSSSLVSGTWNIKSGVTVTYNNKSYSSCAKFEGSTKFNINVAVGTKVTLVLDSAPSSLTIDGGTASSGFISATGYATYTYTTTKSPSVVEKNSGTPNLACIVLETSE